MPTDTRPFDSRIVLKSKELIMEFYKYSYDKLQEKVADNNDDRFLAARLASTMTHAYYAELLKEAIEKEQGKGLG